MSDTDNNTQSHEVEYQLIGSALKDGKVYPKCTLAFPTF